MMMTMDLNIFLRMIYATLLQQTIDNYDINSYIQIENWDPIRKCGFLYLKLYICALEENDVWGSPHNLIFVLLQFRLV